MKLVVVITIISVIKWYYYGIIPFSYNNGHYMYIYMFEISKCRKKSTNLFDGIRKNSIVYSDCISLIWAKFHYIVHF